ncbi:MAG: HD domain-containing protein [bacterium]|nr:HD domain-containing protein [bacterium]
MKQLTLDLIDTVRGISECVDLVNPVFSHHHKRVTCIALNIAQRMGLSLEEKRELAIASLLHDVGALSIKERVKYLEFESDFGVKNPYNHAEIGYYLFKEFKPFLNPAIYIRYHHTYYADIEKDSLPLGAYILHLADRVAISIREGDILLQSKTIKDRIRAQSNRMFNPEVVDGFLSASSVDGFWFDAVYMPLDALIRENNLSKGINITLDELSSFAWIFHILIDFRSRYTATHSCGVAGVALELARILGFSKDELKLMEIAGYLHDLGKIAIPVEILEKSDRLTEEEFNLMKFHVYYTYRILEDIEGLEQINTWGAFHHERLDGSGYPFGLREEDLPLGSRIVQVADVFTALTEDRPYRKALPIDDALIHIETLVRDKKLDRNVFSVLRSNVDLVMERLSEVRRRGLEKFNNFYSTLGVNDYAFSVE